MTSEDGDTGPKRTPPRRFGQLPDLAITDDFDEPLLPDEIEAWETPDDPASPADSGALKEEWTIDDLDDWPFDDPSIDVAALHKSLLESEADLAAGRTFSEEDIRARYGLPR